MSLANVAEVVVGKAKQELLNKIALTSNERKWLYYGMTVLLKRMHKQREIPTGKFWYFMDILNDAYLNGEHDKKEQR